MHIITILSGGMDSTTLAYYLHAQGHTQHFLTFDYGQRHRREIDSARTIAGHLGGVHDVIDLRSITHLLKGSALTDGVSVPHGHYAEESMKQTVVPNRNAIMLSIAYATAVADEANAVAIGVHAGDHFIYPDCRPPFVRAAALAFQLGNDSDIEILTPFIHMTKGDIAATGVTLGVPYADTWTCYEGGAVACGKCGACVERAEAFVFAGTIDPAI